MTLLFLDVRHCGPQHDPSWLAWPQVMSWWPPLLSTMTMMITTTNTPTKSGSFCTILPIVKYEHDLAPRACSTLVHMKKLHALILAYVAEQTFS